MTAWCAGSTSCLSHLRRGRRLRGVQQDSSRAKSNGLNLPECSPDVKLLSVESKVDAAGVSGLDHDFLPAAHGALAARGQKFGGDCFAVRGDRAPGFFTGLDHDRRLAPS